jgi:hypothetical protein
MNSPSTPCSHRKLLRSHSLFHPMRWLSLYPDHPPPFFSFQCLGCVSLTRDVRQTVSFLPSCNVWTTTADIRQPSQCPFFCLVMLGCAYTIGMFDTTTARVFFRLVMFGPRLNYRDVRQSLFFLPSCNVWATLTL